MNPPLLYVVSFQDMGDPSSPQLPFAALSNFNVSFRPSPVGHALDKIVIVFIRVSCLTCAL